MIFGFERLEPSATLPRHRHAEPHVTLVLEGTYSEVGDEGRWTARPGAVLVHRPYLAHFNCVAPTGARVLNLPIGENAPLFACGSCTDADTVAKLAERNLIEASLCLIESTRTQPTELRDWPDLLAAALRAGPNLPICEWARGQGLANESVSRRFRAMFGVSPKMFRAEARAYAAWRQIVDTDVTLAAVATDVGFADQAHMTRAITSLTGTTPGAWRRRARLRDSASFK